MEFHHRNMEAALPSKRSASADPMAAKVATSTGYPTSKLNTSFHSRLGLARAQKVVRNGKPSTRETHPAQLGSTPNMQRRPTTTDAGGPRRTGRHARCLLSRAIEHKGLVLCHSLQLNILMGVQGKLHQGPLLVVGGFTMSGLGRTAGSLHSHHTRTGALFPLGNSSYTQVSLRYSRYALLLPKPPRGGCRAAVVSAAG